jgi:hypothetical protein
VSISKANKQSMVSQGRGSEIKLHDARGGSSAMVSGHFGSQITGLGKSGNTSFKEFKNSQADPNQQFQDDQQEALSFGGRQILKLKNQDTVTLLNENKDHWIPDQKAKACSNGSCSKDFGFF